MQRHGSALIVSFVASFFDRGLFILFPQAQRQGEDG